MTATVSGAPSGALVDDAGLLAGDPGDVVAEVFDVVDADRGDDRDRRVDHVGGVPATAHAHLDDGDVDGRVGERRERHRGEHLELAHRRAAGGLRLRVDHLHERLDLAVGRHVLRRADRLFRRSRCVRPPIAGAGWWFGRCAACSAVSSASIIRATEVLPLVPATWIDG